MGASQCRMAVWGKGCAAHSATRNVACGGLLGHADRERRSAGVGHDGADNVCPVSVTSRRVKSVKRVQIMWWREVVARVGAAAEVTVYVAAVTWVVVEVKASW